MNSILVEAAGHWGGDPEKFAGRLVVEVCETADAEVLAKLFVLLREGRGAALRLLAERADELQGLPAELPPFTL